MATVSKGLADKLVELDGRYPGDPRVMRIVEYTNFAGGIAYGLEYEHELGRYAESPYVHKPRVYWEAGKAKAMDEARAREIHKAEDLSGSTREELTEADAWVKRYALRELKLRVRPYDKAIQEFVLVMARCHYGSVETDEFLRAMGCYPKWMGEADG